MKKAGMKKAQKEITTLPLMMMRSLALNLSDLCSPSSPPKLLERGRGRGRGLGLLCRETLIIYDMQYIPTLPGFIRSSMCRKMFASCWRALDVCVVEEMKIFYPNESI